MGALPGAPSVREPVSRQSRSAASSWPRVVPSVLRDLVLTSALGLEALQLHGQPGTGVCTASPQCLPGGVDKGGTEELPVRELGGGVGRGVGLQPTQQRKGLVWNIAGVLCGIRQGSVPLICLPLSSVPSAIYVGSIWGPILSH